MTSDRLARLWREFAERECGTYSPLYAAIASSVAEDAELLALISAAPPSGQQPNVLLAAVHYLLLGGADYPLAGVYAGRDMRSRVAPLFRDFVLNRRAEIERLLATRRTQTNEPGRAAALLPGLAAASKHLGERIGLLDAGCSAGINLVMDRFRVDYGPGCCLGPPESPVRIFSERRGSTRLPTAVPAIAERLGIDREPLDLNDDDQVRWLLACIWPDTGRFARTESAIDLTRRLAPKVIAGDMVSDLEAALDRFAARLPVAVLTSWACAYLGADQRGELLEVLSRCSRQRPMAWLSAEAPGVAPAVPVPDDIEYVAGPFSVVGLVTFDSGKARGRALGLCHPHGGWVRWLGHPGGTVTCQ